MDDTSRGGALPHGIEEAKKKLLGMCSDSEDILFSPIRVGGHRCYALWCDGMTDRLKSWELMYKPLSSVKWWRCPTPGKLLDHLCRDDAVLMDSEIVDSCDSLLERVMAGFASLIIEGAGRAVVVGMQGFSYRAISESYTEENVRASREGFAEPLRVNMTMVRRRIKNSLLVFETSSLGSVSKTEVALVYLKDRVGEKMLSSIRERLKNIKLEMVLESGFIEPFFESSRFSLFSGTGHTERPDTLCAKLLEGRVGIMVDGTPFAIILPFLFSENFQSFDDYTNKPYYASFIRVLKYIAFFVSIFLPGVYVAVANFNPEIIPSGLLYNITLSQQSTPLPLMYEALFIHVVYEIVREAGLRLPRPVGHAVSLIGALVIGNAAVEAGIIGPPMVMAVALTAISSFLIPLLYEPITILRFVFIIVGGVLGPFGLTLGLCAMLINICAINSYGVPYASPFTPYSRVLFRDGLIRAGWEKLARKRGRLSDLPGARIGEAGRRDE
jgi:spore germination protein KA